jgi:hypothetical protein
MTAFGGSGWNAVVFSLFFSAKWRSLRALGMRCRATRATANRVDDALLAAYRAHASEISREILDCMGGKVDEVGKAVRDTPDLCDYEERLLPRSCCRLTSWLASKSTR